MARAQLNTTLAELETCVKSMRDLGIVMWSDSPVGSLTLGPDPKRLAKIEKKKAEDPQYERRTHYEELLNRKISDKELEHLP